MALIPRLLELLDVSGALVSIDGLGCQKEIAAKIRDGGGDYVLSVKASAPSACKAAGTTTSSWRSSAVSEVLSWT